MPQPISFSFYSFCSLFVSFGLVICFHTLDPTILKYIQMEVSLVHTRPDTSKIDPFNETFFKRWQERVFSAIDVVNLGHILTDPKPEDGFDLLPT